MAPVEVSARHLHLCREHWEVLFGPGAELHEAKKISQPGQFGAKERVDVVGPRGRLSCRVVGPLRKETQVELSVTDCRAIGVDAVLRVSGDLNGTSGARLEGPQGAVELKQGVVVARRHLHINPKQAAEWGLKHGDAVSIRTSGTRPILFHDVFVRSREGLDELSFMIDTDEANAAGLIGAEAGEIVSD